MSNNTAKYGAAYQAWQITKGNPLTEDQRLELSQLVEKKDFSQAVAWFSHENGHVNVPLSVHACFAFCEQGDGQSLQEAIEQSPFRESDKSILAQISGQYMDWLRLEEQASQLGQQNNVERAVVSLEPVAQRVALSI